MSGPSGGIHNTAKGPQPQKEKFAVQELQIQKMHEDHQKLLQHMEGKIQEENLKESEAEKTRQDVEERLIMLEQRIELCETPHAKKRSQMLNRT